MELESIENASCTCAADSEMTTFLKCDETRPAIHNRFCHNRQIFSATGIDSEVDANRADW